MIKNFSKYLLLFFLVISQARASDICLNWGEGYLYSINTPKGWVLGNEPEKQDGLQAVFYPEGGSWAGSKVVMYGNVAVKKDGQRNIQELIEYNLSKMKKQSPNVRVKHLENLKLGDKEIIIKEWQNNMNTFESVAYIEEKNVIVLIVLSSKDESHYLKSADAFKELVMSYQFYSHKAEYKALEKKQLDPLIEKAQKKVESELGKTYQNSVTNSIGQKLANALKTCSENINKMDNFDAIFIINKHGISEKVYWSDNKTAQCFIRNGPLTWVLPKPPIKDFPYHIGVKIAP